MIDLYRCAVLALSVIAAQGVIAGGWIVVASILSAVPAAIRRFRHPKA